MTLPPSVLASGVELEASKEAASRTGTANSAVAIQSRGVLLTLHYVKASGAAFVVAGLVDYLVVEFRRRIQLSAV